MNKEGDFGLRRNTPQTKKTARLGHGNAVLCSETRGLSDPHDVHEASAPFSSLCAIRSLIKDLWALWCEWERTSIPAGWRGTRRPLKDNGLNPQEGGPPALYLSQE